MARLSASSQGQVQVDDGYLIALAKTGDPTAYDRLVRRYYGFVRLKASSYFLIGGDSDDLIQEGLVGLYKAIRDYRTDRESSFRNFAELCITRQIITAVKTATRNKHAPLNQYVSFASTPGRRRRRRADARRDPPGLDRPRPGQPGDLLRGAAPASSTASRRRSPSSRARVLSLYLDGHSYEEIGEIARLRHEDGRQRPAARQAQGRRASGCAERGAVGTAPWQDSPPQGGLIALGVGGVRGASPGKPLRGRAGSSSAGVGAPIGLSFPGAAPRPPLSRARRQRPVPLGETRQSARGWRVHRRSRPGRDPGEAQTDGETDACGRRPAPHRRGFFRGHVPGATGTPPRPGATRGERQDGEGDDGVVRGGGAGDEGVEDLVVAEDRRGRVRALGRVDDGAGRVEGAAEGDAGEGEPAEVAPDLGRHDRAEPAEADVDGRR